MNEVDRRVAVIGMAVRLPDANTVEEFWRNSLEGRVSLRRFTPEELREAGVPEQVSTMDDYVAVGAPLDDIRAFDASFFGMSPREAAITDPQHRLFLEVCHHALEDAGHAAPSGRVGVYAGTGYHLHPLHGYLRHNLAAEADTDDTLERSRLDVGNHPDFMASRTAYRLGLTGPAVTVQSADSTGLVAVHLASQALLSGDADLAIAGAGAVHVPEILGYRHSDGSILSPTGECRPFDANANGTVGGNGVVAVVLKRLDEALADRDRVHAVVLGVGVNNDGGRKGSYAAASAAGQSAAIRRAIGIAGVDPGDIEYVETHGTGVPRADRAELAGLADAYGSEGSWAIGTAKPMIGHTEEAAGLVGLVRAICAVKHGTIPPVAGLSTPDPHLSLEDGPFHLPSGPLDWPEDGPAASGPRLAGVSAFGLGGTNAHAIVAESPEGWNARMGSVIGERHPAATAEVPGLLPVSADHPEALAELAGALAERLRADEPSLADVLATMATGRRHLGHRLVAYGDTVAEIAGALAGFAEKGRHSRLVTATVTEADDPGVVFAYSGPGGEHPGMARALYGLSAAFRSTVDEADAVLRDLTGETGLLPALLGTEPGDDAGRWSTELSLPALFTVQAAMTDLWSDLGVRPSLVTGHGIGELGALYAARALSLEDGIRLAAGLGSLAWADTPEGGMVAMYGERTTVDTVLAACPGLVVAAANGPGSVVLSGASVTIDKACRLASALDLRAERLPVGRALHSPLLDAIIDDYRELAESVTAHGVEIPFLSAVDGQERPPGWVPDADHLVTQARQTARFDTVLSALSDVHDSVLLEIGPGSELTEIATGAVPSLVPMAAREPAHAVGALYLRGASIDWSALLSGTEGRQIDLPVYPFRRETHWVEPPALPQRTPGPPPPETTLRVEPVAVEEAAVPAPRQLIPTADESSYETLAEAVHAAVNAAASAARTAEELAMRLPAGVRPDLPGLDLPAPRESASETTSPAFALAFTGAGVGAAASYAALREVARFADANGFSALWLPERHFDAGAGPFPNPSVLAASLASETKRIRIGGAGVALPLHDAIRVAEEWSMVDNISGGRAALAVAPGAHASDFVFYPARFADREEVMYDQLADLRRLWRGEALTRRGGEGGDVTVRLHPRPVQDPPPLSAVVGAAREEWIRAAEADLGIVTDLERQTGEELAGNIAAYREARATAGLVPADGHVTVMLRLDLAAEADAARAVVDEVRAVGADEIAAVVGIDGDAAGVREDLVHLALLRERYVVGAEGATAEPAPMDAPPDVVAAEPVPEHVDAHEQVHVSGHVDAQEQVDASAHAPEAVTAEEPPAEPEPEPVAPEPAEPVAAEPEPVVAEEPPAEQPVLVSPWAPKEPAPPVEAVAVAEPEPEPEPEPEAPSPAPLTPAQLAIWTAEREPGGSPVPSTVVHAARLTGPLDVDAFRAALDELTARHPVLRTVVREVDGTPHRVVEPDAEADVEFTEAPGADGHAVLDAARERAFDLGEGPLFTTRLLKLGDDHHLLVFSMHRILMDDASLTLLTRELSALYRGETPEPTVDGPGEVPDAGKTAADLSYWTDRLDGFPRLSLPTDRARTPGTEAATAAEPSAFDPRLSTALREVAHAYGVPLSVVLLAGLALTLRRFTGAEDIGIGTRLPLRSADGGGLGPLTVPAVLRVDLSGDPTIGELIGQMRSRLAEAREHADAPLETVRAAALVQVTADFPEAPPLAIEIPGVTAGILDVPTRPSTVDLAWTFAPGGGQAPIRARLDYPPALFDQATAARFHAYLHDILAATVADPQARPSSLTDLSESDTEVLERWHQGPETALPDTTVHELVAAHATRSPQTVAARHGEDALTYATLESLANQLAHQLRALGVGPSDVVAVWLPTDLRMIVAYLAVLKAGAAYLAVDPAAGDEAVRHVLTDSRATLTVTESGLAGRLPRGVAHLCPNPSELATFPTTAPPRAAAADSGCYVVYTPDGKGAVVSHLAAVNLCGWYARRFQLTPADRAAVAGAPGTDTAPLEIWPALTTGAGITVVPEQVRQTGPGGLAEWLGGNEITLSLLPAEQGRELMALPAERQPGLRALIVNGTELRRPAAPVPYDVVRTYIPDGGAVLATAHNLSADGPRTVPLGSPVDNTRLFVLDADGHPAPIGMTGELYLAGPALASGYLHDESLTAQRFPVDSAGNRYFRSGDLVRWTNTGELEYAGRVDMPPIAEGETGEPKDTVEAPPSLSTGDQSGAGDLHDRLTSLWAAELGARPSDPDASFFTLGGHPLSASRLLSAVRQTFHVDYPDAEFGREPTLRAMVTHIERALHTQPPEPVDKPVDNAPPQAPEAAAEPATNPIPAHGPLTPEQERIADGSVPPTTYWNLTFRLHLTGELDPAALRSALAAVTERHQSLRTRYGKESGRWLQEVRETGAELKMVDLSAQPEAQRILSADRRCHAAATEPFDLTEGAAWRAILLRLSAGDTPAEQEWHLILVVHHLVCDGLSVSVLLRELAEVYTANAQGRPPKLLAAARPIDHAARRLAGEEAPPDRLAYWMKRLADVPISVPLPYDRAPGSVAVETAQVQRVPLPPNLVAAVQRIAGERGTTPFSVLAGAFGVFLARMTGQRNLMLSAPYAARQIRGEEPLLGAVADDMLLDIRVDTAAGFATLVDRVAGAVHDGRTHYVPADTLLSALKARRAPAEDPHPPLAFTYQDFFAEPIELPGLSVDVEEVPIVGARPWPSFTCTPGPEGWTAAVVHSPQLVDPGTARGWLDSYVGALAKLCARPEVAIGEL